MTRTRLATVAVVLLLMYAAAWMTTQVERKRCVELLVEYQTAMNFRPKVVFSDPDRKPTYEYMTIFDKREAIGQLDIHSKPGTIILRNLTGMNACEVTK